MKKVTYLALLLLVLASVAFGQQAKNGGIAREAAMGGSQAGTGVVVNPFIMDDPTLMLLNPAYVAMYRDYGWANISGGALTGTAPGSTGFGQQNAGIAFGLGDDFTIGAILSYDPSAVNTLGLLNGLSPVFQRAPQAIPAVANTWELVLAYRMSSVDLGFGFLYGNSNHDSTFSSATPAIDNTREASAHLWGFRGGANFDLGGGSSLDLSAALRLDKANDKIDNTPTITGEGGDYSNSATEFQVLARGKFRITSKFNFVPYGVFATASAEPKEDMPPAGDAATQSSLKFTANAYALGIGGEYRTQSTYIAGGVSWQSASLKEEAKVGTNPSVTTTNSYTAIPVLNLGAEWWFTDWLAGRTGYFRSMGNLYHKEETTGLTLESNLTAPNSAILVGGLNGADYDGIVTLGLALRFGGWGFDATVSDEALRRGLGLIGAQDAINTFGYITASYNFAE